MNAFETEDGVAALGCRLAPGSSDTARVNSAMILENEPTVLVPIAPVRLRVSGKGDTMSNRIPAMSSRLQRYVPAAEANALVALTHETAWRMQA
ncbi:hypothetical protein [Sphingobium chlorophenolicum]|nr:hypothetical protein [Sphingobium chlorophenolicum]